MMFVTEPSSFVTKMLLLPFQFPVKASRAPFGDQTGSNSLVPNEEITCRPVPSGFITKTSRPLVVGSFATKTILPLAPGNVAPADCAYFFMKSLDALVHLLEHRERDHTNEKAFAEAQAILIAAANISKILWTGGRKATPESIVRAKELRDLLGVKGRWSLSQRTVRNSFEHFDDRLDEWGATGAGFADCNVGSIKDMEALVPAKEIFRHIDPSTATITFQGKRFDLPRMLVEIKKLRHSALDGLAESEKYGPIAQMLDTSRDTQNQ